MATEFKIKGIFNFTTKAPAILGNSFTNMRVKGIMDFEEGVKYRDIATLHSTVKPTIGGIADDVKDLTFILFETLDGEDVLLAKEYINADSVAQVQSVNIRAEINNVTTEDISIIKTKLQELGYSNVTVGSYE